MKQLQDGRGWLLLGAALCAAVAGCGDIGDAQVPLPVHAPRSSGRSSDEPPFDEPPFDERAPGDDAADAAHRPQAVMRLSVAPGAAACPFAFEALLPDASASVTLEDGHGERSVSGDGALIACRVGAQLFSEGVFELDLFVWHEQQPLLRAKGQLGPKSSSLALDLDVPGRGSLAARCTVQPNQLVVGAVWFQTLGCHAFEQEGADAAACDIELDAIFENCRQ
jgi:hypothetical protein